MTRMIGFFKNFVKYLLASSLILSAGATVGVTQTFGAENDGSKVIEDGGGQGGVTWEESYRKASGSYTIIVYRSANGGNQWKEVTYDKNGNIVKVVYGTY